MRTSQGPLDVTTIWSKDVDCAVHIPGENGTVMDVTPSDESFKFLNGCTTGAMKGNPSQFGVLLLSFGVELKVVGHWLQRELEL